MMYTRCCLKNASKIASGTSGCFDFSMEILMSFRSTIAIWLALCFILNSSYKLLIAEIVSALNILICPYSSPSLSAYTYEFLVGCSISSEVLSMNSLKSLKLIRPSCTRFSLHPIDTLPCRDLCWQTAAQTLPQIRLVRPLTQTLQFNFVKRFAYFTYECATAHGWPSSPN